MNGVTVVTIEDAMQQLRRAVYSCEGVTLFFEGEYDATIVSRYFSQHLESAEVKVDEGMVEVLENTSSMHAFWRHVDELIQRAGVAPESVFGGAELFGELDELPPY